MTNLTFSTPPGLAAHPGYTHVVEADNPGRIVYISGQLGSDSTGRIVGAAGDFEAQAKQVFENLKTALDSAGADFGNVAKLNMYIVDIQKHLSPLMRILASYANEGAPPANTAIGVVGLAEPDALLEIEAVAILPRHS